MHHHFWYLAATLYVCFRWSYRRKAALRFSESVPSKRGRFGQGLPLLRSSVLVTRTLGFVCSLFRSKIFLSVDQFAQAYGAGSVCSGITMALFDARLFLFRASWLFGFFGDLWYVALRWLHYHFYFFYFGYVSIMAWELSPLRCTPFYPWLLSLLEHHWQPFWSLVHPGYWVSCFDHPFACIVCSCG